MPSRRSLTRSVQPSPTDFHDRREPRWRGAPAARAIPMSHRRRVDVVLRVAARRRAVDERGATAVEYALLTALIAGVLVGTIFTLGQQVIALFNLVVGRF